MPIATNYYFQEYPASHLRFLATPFRCCSSHTLTPLLNSALQHLPSKKWASSTHSQTPELSPLCKPSQSCWTSGCLLRMVCLSHSPWRPVPYSTCPTPWLRWYHTIFARMALALIGYALSSSVVENKRNCIGAYRIQSDFREPTNLWRDPRILCILW